MHYFCTLFDSNYLLKGVAMLRTLKQHCPDAQVRAPRSAGKPHRSYRGTGALRRFRKHTRTPPHGLKFLLMLLVRILLAKSPRR